MKLIIKAGLFLVISGFLAGCIEQSDSKNEEQDSPAQNASAQHDYDAAAYLIALQAAANGDIELAANYYTAALAKDPARVALLERSFRTLYFSGQIDDAVIVASTLEKAGISINLGSEPAAAVVARNNDWGGVEIIARHLNADSISRPLGIVFEAWALAFQGRGDAAISQLRKLERISENSNINDGADADRGKQKFQMHLRQSALMMEYLGHYQDAVDIARIAIAHEGASADTVLLMAGLLARNNAIDEAEHHIKQRLNHYYAVDFIISTLADASSTLMQKPEPLALLANATVDVSLNSDINFLVQLSRLHLAMYIDNNFDRGNYHLYRLHRQIESIEAIPPYNSIQATSPWYQPTRILDALAYSINARNYKEADIIFKELLTASPKNPQLWKFVGDNARRHEVFDLALEAYSKALHFDGNVGDVYYSRGIVLDHLGRDEDAENNFRLSLKEGSDNAYVLNYFGYWLLENGGNVDEALAMINQAVNIEPRNGFFVDSLGWGYFLSGHYDRAVFLLERAVTLEPTDATIIDHLGDAYAKTGRLREAIYEWERALYYANQKIMRDTIETKLHKARQQSTPQQDTPQQNTP